MNKTLTDVAPVQNESSTSEDSSISLEDRIDHLADEFNKMIAKNPGKTFQKNSLVDFITEILTKPDQQIKENALNKLSPIERKSLGLYNK